MRDPPKPRLSTGSPGKSVARDSQYRIDELPTKSTGDGGGGDALSSRTKALSSAAKRALSGSGVGATTAAGRAPVPGRGVGVQATAASTIAKQNDDVRARIRAPVRRWRKCSVLTRRRPVRRGGPSA